MVDEILVDHRVHPSLDKLVGDHSVFTDCGDEGHGELLLGGIPPCRQLLLTPGLHAFRPELLLIKCLQLGNSVSWLPWEATQLSGNPYTLSRIQVELWYLEREPLSFNASLLSHGRCHV